MRLDDTGRRNLHQSGVFAKRGQVRRAAQSHTGANTSHQLEDQIFQLALIWYAGLDPFRNQLRSFLRRVLEIAVR